MFDCKGSGSDQSEDKRNCHIYVTSILSITLVMFSLIQSTFSAVFFLFVRFVPFAFVCMLCSHVAQECLCGIK